MLYTDDMDIKEENVRLKADNEELTKALEALKDAFDTVYASHSRLVNK